MCIFYSNKFKCGWFCEKERIVYLKPVSFETKTLFIDLFDITETLSRVQTILILLRIYR